MKKLNIKLLSTASALAFVVMGAAARADDSFLYNSLDPENFYYLINWNEQNAEAAAGVAINNAIQVAATYAVQIGGTDPVQFEALDEITIDQYYWTGSLTSYGDDGLNDDGEDYWSGMLVVNANSISANTTIKDALVEAVNQTALTTFQTASIDILGSDSIDGSPTIINIQQFADGANYFDDNGENAYDRDTAYTFALISRNEIDASAAYQGTAVIDGAIFDEELQEMVNGSQQAVVTMNTIAVSAANGENILVNLDSDSLYGDLNAGDFSYGGQGFDIEGLSGGSNYWNGNDDAEDPFFDYEQFTLESTNFAGAYAPHGLTNTDPAVRNLDQKAFVNANTITVGNEVLGDGTDIEDYGTADFTIMATVSDFDPENSYELGQFANFNGNSNNLASLNPYITNNLNDLDIADAYWDGEANWMSEVRIGNTVVATTELDEYAYQAGGADVAGIEYWTEHENFNQEGSDDSPLLDYIDDLEDRDYLVGYGDAALSDISQVASLGVNAISNIGDGTLKLISVEVGDGEDSLVGYDFTKALSFTQSVTNFEYSNGHVPFGSSFDNSDMQDGGYWFDGPLGYINTALAETENGDINIDAIDQTTSFAFNSIASVGDIQGWTNLDPENPSINFDPENPATLLASEDYDAGIVQYADTSFYFAEQYGNENAVQGLYVNSDDGELNVSDVNQVLSITANTMSSNGTIISDIDQTAVGEWDFEEPNEIDLDTEGGDITGGDLTQTAIFTANTISTSDLVEVDPNDDSEITVKFGGDLIAALVTQDASGLSMDYWDEGAYTNLNEIEITTDEDVDVGMMSQYYQVTLNQVDVAGSILIGEYEDDTDTSNLLQSGNTDDLFVYNLINVAPYWEDEAHEDVLVGDDADNVGVQYGYLNVNSIKAGDLLSGNVEQDINADYYEVINEIDAYSPAHDVDVSYFTQSGAVSLNTIAAGTLEGAYIQQDILGDLEVRIDNIASAVVDASSGVASVQNITQQAVTKINTIGGIAPVAP